MTDLTTSKVFNARPAPAPARLTDQEEQRIVRQVEQLRACAGDYRLFSAERVQRWLAWWAANHQGLDLRGPPPRQAYTLVLLIYLGLDPREVPVVYEDERTIIWRSTNFCPTLEACHRLGLDTRIVCRAATEGAVQELIARLDPRLRFSRNYEAGIRPYAEYCEEQIALQEGRTISPSVLTLLTTLRGNCGVPSVWEGTGGSGRREPPWGKTQVLQGRIGVMDLMLG